MNRALTIGDIVFALFLVAVAVGVIVWFGTDRKEKSPPALTLESGIQGVVPGASGAAKWVAKADDPATVPIFVSDGERSFTLMSTPGLLLGNVAAESTPLGNDALTELLAKKYDGDVIPGGSHGEWVGAAADGSESAATESGNDDGSWFGGVASLLGNASGKLRATIAAVDGAKTSTAGEHYFIRVGESDTMLVIDREARGGTIFEQDIRAMMSSLSGE